MALLLPNPHPKQAEFLADPHRYKVLNWGRRCLAAGTKVLTPNGPAAIEELKVGDSVFGYENDKVVESTVIETHNNGVVPVHDVVTPLGTITSSVDHRWLIDYAPSSGVKPRIAALPKHKGAGIRRAYTTIPGGKVDNQTAYALGALTGDGCSRQSGNLLYISSANEQIVKKVANLLQSDYRKCAGGNYTWSLGVTKPEHYEWLDGKYAHEKLAEWSVVDTWNRASALAYLAGLIDTDGSVTHRIGQEELRIRLGMQAKPVVEVAQKIVEKFFLTKPPIYLDDRPKYKNGPLYTLSITNSFEAKRILRELDKYLLSDSKKWKPEYDNISSHRNGKRSSYRLGNTHETQTYDITVSNPSHLYLLANGLVTSNTGKSVAVWEKVVLEGMLRQGTYYIICPTYKQAKSIYWREIVKRYKGEFMSFNEQELAITFDHLSGIKIPSTDRDGNPIDITVNHDPNLPPTRIELKGADNPESLRGVSLSGVVLDEYAFMPEGKYVYDVIIRPALADKDGWAVFVSTPNGVYNHFHELREKALKDPDVYYYSHATSLDNPYFKKSEFEEVKREYESEGKMDAFNQEYMAEFSNPTTLVYGRFQPDLHVFGPKRAIDSMPMQGTYCLAIDFGMTDPTAAIFIMIDKDGNWWVYDEIYQPDLDLDRLVYVLRDKMGENHFTRIVGDGAARFELESLRKRRFRITGAKKGADSLHNGIKEVIALLTVREGTGLPKLFVASHCKNTIREFESYSWERDAFGEITNIPEDKNNHALDAIRYLALDKANPVERTKRKREWDPDTGRAWN